MSSPNNCSASRTGAGKLHLLPHTPSSPEASAVNKVVLTGSHAHSFTVDFLLHQQSSEETTGLADPKMYAKCLLH